MTRKFRSKWNLGMTLRPWSSRPHVHFNGCSRQGNDYNLLRELCDLRWARYASERGIDMHSNIIPSNLWCDTRQNIYRQRRDGTLTMLSKTLAYNYSRDRCATGVEMLMHQGWSSDINATDINARVPDWPDELRFYQSKKKEGDDPSTSSAPPPKRRKTNRCPYSGTSLTDLAGNGMAIPDLSLVVNASFLSMRSNLFQNPPPENFVEMLGGERNVKVEIDPTCESESQRIYHDLCCGDD